MKTLFALIAVFVVIASAMAQSPGTGNIVLQNGATLNTPTINSPVVNAPVIIAPSFTITSGTNTYVLNPVITGTGTIVITGGTTSTRLSGTGAITGALAGNSVFVLQGVTLPAGANIYGSNIANSGTAILTISVTGTTVIPSGTYSIATVAF